MEIDLIETVTEFKHIQLRLINEETSEYHRTVLMCGDFEKANQYGPEIVTLVNSLWTEELIEAYKNSRNLI